MSKEKNNEPTFIYVDGCGYVGIFLTREIAEQCYHSGSCDDDCNYWVKQPFIKDQLDQIPYEDIINCLHEIWTDWDMDNDEITNATKEENYARILFEASAQFIEYSAE